VTATATADDYLLLILNTHQHDQLRVVVEILRSTQNISVSLFFHTLDFWFNFYCFIILVYLIFCKTWIEVHNMTI